MAENEKVVVEQPVVEETTQEVVMGPVEGASIITIKKLLEAGSQFGHQTKRWNPKMAQYIYTPRNGIYIIDLQKTVTCVEAASNNFLIVMIEAPSTGPITTSCVTSSVTGCSTTTFSCSAILIFLLVCFPPQPFVYKLGWQAVCVLL